MDRILDGSPSHDGRDHAYEHARVTRHKYKMCTSANRELHVCPPYDFFFQLNRVAL